MSKKVPLYLCDKKCDCNNPCYKYCRLTHDINHAVRDDEGNPIIGAYFEDPGDTWSAARLIEEIMNEHGSKDDLLDAIKYGLCCLDAQKYGLDLDDAQIKFGYQELYSKYMLEGDKA